MKTWKTSKDPDYAAKKARVEHLYALADGEVIPEEGEPDVGPGGRGQSLTHGCAWFRTGGAAAS
ncbi:hypothetical protein QFZ67_000386 [Streptomyces sp. V1I1]|nr:hypothetical protein [Streptomyces sp. V1I1]